MHNKTRERWTGRLGIILAAAGSAIGLGNLLRFPAIASQNGGGAFIIPYFVALFVLGLPLCWVEWTLGRFGGKHHCGNSPAIFDKLKPNRPFLKYFGTLGVVGPLGIFIYYIYIESWTLGYTWFAFTAAYHGITDPQEMNAFFTEFLSGKTRFIFFALTFIVNMLIIYRGVSKGIEKFCRATIPLLAVIGIVLAIRVAFLGAPLPEQPEWNVNNGFGFLWNPDFSSLLKPKVWLAAAGQIFFTLSIGIGCLMTYASYLHEKHDVTLSSMTSAFLNEFMEVIIGASIVIPAAFCFFGPIGTQTAIDGGMFGLAFRTMPLIFNHTAGGGLVGLVWFLLLFIAGVTSSVSIFQPSVAFVEERLHASKHKTVLGIGAVVLLCSPAVLFIDGAVDEMDFWFSSFGLPLFAFIELCVFLRYIGLDNGWKLLHEHAIIRIPGCFKYVLGFVTPVVLASILLSWLLTSGWRSILLLDVPHEKLLGILTVRLMCATLVAVTIWLIQKTHPNTVADDAPAEAPQEVA